jgi:hypothetical protein
MLAAAVTAACSGSGAKKTPTAASTATLAPPQATATIDITQPQAIRSIDVTTAGEVRLLEVQSAGARADISLVIYGDLTGDGVEEAVVPLALGGRTSEVGFVALKLDSSSPGRVKGIYSGLATGGAISLRIEGGKLIETQGVASADDPECCPSTLRVTTLGWNGSALVVESTNTIPNPSGGLKGTPTAGASPPAQ